MHIVIPEITFHHAVAIQTRFNDFDRFGHANNGAYLQYFDVGKLAYFGQFSEGSFDPVAQELVIASIKLDFINQVLPGDSVEVLSAVTHIGNTSLVLEQRITSDNRKKIHATSTGTLVQYDPMTKTTIRISDLWRSRLTAFEQRSLE